MHTYIYIFEDICMYIYIHMCYHGLLNIYIPLIIIMHTYIYISFLRTYVCTYIYTHKGYHGFHLIYIPLIIIMIYIYIYVLVLCIVASVLDPYGLSVCVISPVKYGVYKYIYIHTDAVRLFF